MSGWSEKPCPDTPGTGRPQNLLALTKVRPPVPKNHFPLDAPLRIRYITSVAWDIEFTDEFGAWYGELAAAEQESMIFSIELLKAHGPTLARPHVDTVRVRSTGT